jgi:hypothetical protein
MIEVIENQFCVDHIPPSEMVMFSIHLATVATNMKLHSEHINVCFNLQSYRQASCCLCH